MQYGAMIPNLGAAVDPVEITALTHRVEETGYDTLMVSDHIVMPTELKSRYPYNSSGIPSFNADKRHPRALHPPRLSRRHHPARPPRHLRPSPPLPPPPSSTPR